MVKTAIRLPSSLVRREASLASTGYSTWVQARANKDYALFAPVLQEWIEIKRERGRFIDADKPLYDVLADEYSQGMTSARITQIFDDVKKDLAPFLSKLKQHGKRPDVKCLQGKFDVKVQEALGRDIAAAIGFDFEKGRLDTSVHPCTFGIHASDVRITTRYKADDMMEALTGTVHEVGHALYEQGLNLDVDGLLVDKACGMAVHESQSLLWERMVMLGLPFARFLLPKLKEAFPDSGFGRLDAQELHRACNAMVDQSFIRVEADEVRVIVNILVCNKCIVRQGWHYRDEYKHSDYHIL